MTLDDLIDDWLLGFICDPVGPSHNRIEVLAIEIDDLDMVAPIRQRGSDVAHKITTERVRIGMGEYDEHVHDNDAGTSATAPAAPRTMSSSTLVTMSARPLSRALLATLLVFAPTMISTPVAAVSHPSVFVVGDSVAVAAESRLTSRLADDFDFAVDTAESRTTAAGSAIVTAATATSAVDVLVIELGYNDGGNAATFSSRVDALPSAANADVIVWLTLREDERNTFDYGPANAALRAKTAKDSWLRILDWDAVSQDENVTWDGIHLTSDGARLLTDVIESAILTAIATGPKGTCTSSQVPRATPDAAAGNGYWLLDSTGDVHTYGSAVDYGDLIDDDVAAFPRSIQATSTGLGYWIVDEDGRVHAYGDAGFFGDMTGFVLNSPIRRLEAHPNRSGYWLVADDGGVFSFGVDFHGSTGNLVLRQPVVSLSATSTGNGYWLVAGDGGVFSFGDAEFRGSTGGLTLNAPVIDLAADPLDRGYWLYAEDGGVFSFGLPFFGSTPGMGLCVIPTTVAMRVTATGGGYWLVTDRGWVITFRDALDFGDRPALPPGSSIIDMAVL